VVEWKPSEENLVPKITIEHREREREREKERELIEWQQMHNNNEEEQLMIDDWRIQTTT